MIEKSKAIDQRNKEKKMMVWLVQDKQTVNGCFCLAIGVDTNCCVLNSTWSIGSWVVVVVVEEMMMMTLLMMKRKKRIIFYVRICNKQSKWLEKYFEKKSRADCDRHAKSIFFTLFIFLNIDQTVIIKRRKEKSTWYWVKWKQSTIPICVW